MYIKNTFSMKASRCYQNFQMHVIVPNIYYLWKIKKVLLLHVTGFSLNDLSVYLFIYFDYCMC